MLRADKKLENSTCTALLPIAFKAFYCAQRLPNRIFLDCVQCCQALSRETFYFDFETLDFVGEDIGLVLLSALFLDLKVARSESRV
jgi:hypothetical protein